MSKSNRTVRAVAAAAAALASACLALPMSAQAQEVVRLGNLKFAHYGAVSYMKEIAPKCGIKVEEKIFAKGPDVMQAIVAGELDVGATASEAAISRPRQRRADLRGGRLRQGRRAPGGRARRGIKIGRGPEGQERRRHARRHPGSAAARRTRTRHGLTLVRRSRARTCS